MRVLVTGSTGFIGSALVPVLRDEGHEVVRLVRRRRGSAEREVVWDPERDAIDRDGLEGIGAVVHLAGENIANGLWTRQRKARIWDSRVEGTRLLCDALGGLRQPPKTLVAMSGVGFYGDRGDELLDEESQPGSSFLADLCRAWEAAARGAETYGVRVVNLRLGMVLSPEGGPLKPMLRVFRLGLGGRIGSGRAYMSWISLEDALCVITHCLGNGRLSGPVNAVSPVPVTNRAFTAALGNALGRPAICTVPAFGIRLLLGQMGRELLLASARAVPRRLLESGYVFRLRNIETTLQSLVAGP